MHPLNVHLRMLPAMLVGKEGACKTKKHMQQTRESQQAKGTHLVEESDQEDVEEYYMFKVTSKREEPIQVTVLMDQQEVVMEVDTGASLSLINVTRFARRGLIHAPLQYTDFTTTR